MTAWTTISVRPASKTAFRAKLFEIATSQASVGIRPGVFNDDFPGIVLYSRNMDERRGIMHGVFISDEREGQTPATILAQKGSFISDPENLRLTLRLTDGSIHRRPEKEKKMTYQTIFFGSYDINLGIDEQLSAPQRRRRSRSELSWKELEESISKETRELSRNRLEVENTRGLP